MNASATQGFLFPNITANISMQPGGISNQILLLQILHLTQQFSQIHNTLREQHLNLFNHSQDSQQEFHEIKKSFKESNCEANTTFDHFRQMRLEIQNKNNTINIQRQTIEDLQVQVQNYSQLVDSKTTINEYLNSKLLDLQQQLENKNIQHKNISSELLECKIKSNTKTIIRDPTDCTVEQTNQLGLIWTEFKVCEQEKETMETEYKKQLKVLAEEAEKHQSLNKAVAENNSEKVKVLLEAGVSTETVDNNGCRPLYNASYQGNLDIVKVLVQYEANLYAGREDRRGDMCIHAAAGEGKKEVLQFLLDKGMPVDTKNKYGQTALGNAAWFGQYDVAKMLIQRGAKVNLILNSHVSNPLDSAAYQGHVCVVELLLDHGADINAVSFGNRTALHDAAQNGHLNVVKLLVKRGINVNVISTLGRTAKDLATMFNFPDVANYLASV